jgi:hypothetical protein
MAGPINLGFLKTENKCDKLEKRDGIYFVSATNKAVREGFSFVDFVNFYYNTPDPRTIGADNLIAALKTMQTKPARKRRI